MIVARILRIAAVMIAILGVVDPAVTLSRRVPVTVSFIGETAASASRTVFSRIEHSLGRDFVVTHGLASDAAAVITVGDALPDEATSTAVPAFAVVPEGNGPAVAIEWLHAPVRVPVEARVEVLVGLRTKRSAGRTLDVVLNADGAAANRVTRTVSGNEDLVTVPLTVVPTGAGAIHLRAEVRIVGDSSVPVAAADTLVSADRRQWQVLFFDTRPSWMSTFVRRALEADPRFVVSARTQTSRGLSARTASAPANLADAISFDRFDAIVLGTPDLLSSSEASRVDEYLRRRGGSVVALMDAAGSASVSAIDRIAGVTAWHNLMTPTTVDLVRSSSAEIALRASEMRSPTPLPAGAESLVGASDRGMASAIWRTAVGPGRLVVSGALDAWRYRTAKTPSFDLFWRDLVADAAAATPRPITVTLDRQVLVPGDRTLARVVVTSAALSNADRVHASVSATISGPSGSVPVRFWPSGLPGEFAATVRAPGTPGEYRMTVANAEGTGESIFIVDPAARRPEPDQRELVTAWTASRGGAVVSEKDIERLPELISRAVTAGRRDEPAYPMRHGWWIAPFVLCLGGEWWWRRRQGRA